MRTWLRNLDRREALTYGLIAAAGGVVLVVGLGLAASWRSRPALASSGGGLGASPVRGVGARSSESALAGRIRLTSDQAEAIGLKVATVVEGSASDVLEAPG